MSVYCTTPDTVSLWGTLHVTLHSGRVGAGFTFLEWTWGVWAPPVCDTEIKMKLFSPARVHPEEPWGKTQHLFPTEPLVNLQNTTPNATIKKSLVLPVNTAVYFYCKELLSVSVTHMEGSAKHNGKKSNLFVHLQHPLSNVRHDIIANQENDFLSLVV